MQRIEVNVQTGEQIVIDLTAEEIAAAQAQTAEWEAQQALAAVRPTLEQTVTAQQELITDLTARLATLEAK